MAGADAADQVEQRRFRPYRVVAYGVYLVVAVGFSLLILVNVTRSVVSMTPGRPVVTGETLSAEQCVGRSEALFGELDQHRRGFSEAKAVAAADAEWSRFRIGWLTRLRQLEASCALDRAEREKLRPVFRRLDKLLDLYTTHATQFAGEIGPTIDKFRTSVDEARAAPP